MTEIIGRIEALMEENRELKEALKGAKIICEVAQEERNEWKARCQAAERDMNDLLSLCGLQCYEACRFCARPDDETCAAGASKGRCNAVWRGPCGENSGAE